MALGDAGEIERGGGEAPGAATVLLDMAPARDSERVGDCRVPGDAGTGAAGAEAPEIGKVAHRRIERAAACLGHFERGGKNLGETGRQRLPAAGRGGIESREMRGRVPMAHLGDDARENGLDLGIGPGACPDRANRPGRAHRLTVERNDRRRSLPPVESRRRQALGDRDPRVDQGASTSSVVV